MIHQLEKVDIGYVKIVGELIGVKMVFSEFDMGKREYVTLLPMCLE